MPSNESHRYASLEDALEHARDVLKEKFGDVDQSAAVQLAQVMYTVQERERFEARGGDQTPPYRQ